ncbi:MAG: 2-oxo acid dehydrogenase subunit E2 [Candidatus Thermoplasmatota archaeon]|nr:2-oxo acid dehydrogenase subunit E2 [Candidatus Thermoplasmatota archaeon]
MDKIGSYETKPFSKSRQDIALVSGEGKRKLKIYALLEFDVTKARGIIQASKGKFDVSFTAWLIKCVSQAASEHKQMNAYRQGRRRMVLFDDVDIPIPVEREVDGDIRPLAYIVRQANKKTVEEITREIRQAQSQAVDADTEVLGESLTRGERFVIHAPLWIKKLGLRVLRRRGLLKKKHLGTIGVTSIGMKGRFPGWVLGMGGPIATLVAVGGITKKPGVVHDEIHVREYLHVSITTDHSIVDGGPLARFVARLTELLETGFGLPADLP